MSKRSAASFIPAGFLGTVIVIVVAAFVIPHHTTTFFVHLLVVAAVVGAVEVVAGMAIIAFALRKKRLPPSG